MQIKDLNKKIKNIKPKMKKKIEEYLDNKISLEDLNLYFIENVPFIPNTVIDHIVLDVDMTTDKELTDIDIEEGIMDENTLKIKLIEHLKILENFKLDDNYNIWWTE